MRTQKYIQVEAIVAKYETLASETEAVKKTRDSFTEFYVPDDSWRLDFIEQLIGHIYELKAGKLANPDVIKEYSNYTPYYIKGLLNKDEEQYLVNNFDIFLDYVFAHLNLICCLGYDFEEPSEWSGLVPYILDNRSGKIFIANSDNGKEFVGLNNCDLTVAVGFENAAIRAFAYGYDIHKYNYSYKKHTLSDIKDKEFNTVIVDLSSNMSSVHDDDVEKYLKDCNRIVKDGGEILLCLSKAQILKEFTKSFRSLIVSEKTLQEAIQLPSGNILFHIVKKTHNSFVMCDASQLSQKDNERIIDIDAFLKEVKMADMPEREDCPIIRRYAYDKLLGSMLLPKYYLTFPQEGSPIGKFTTIETELFLTDECGAEEKVVTINHLSNVFTKGEFKTTDLPNLNCDRLRRYYRVNGPAVVMAVSKHDIAIGYTIENTSFLVPRNLYVLKPKEGVNVKYLAGRLLSNSLKKQITTFVYYDGRDRLSDNWSDLVLLKLHNSEMQQQFVQESILKDFAHQEKYVAEQEKGFKHVIHLRKHALSQNISAFDSLFRSLEFCMKEHGGHIKSTDQLSPVSSMTVGEAMNILHSDLDVICSRVTHLTDDNDWGKCEIIEPQQFIENYEKQHKNTIFSFSHLWDNFEKNYFIKDILDTRTGKLLFYKGESMRTAWFPPKALLQIFDNIVSNACEHGFKDKSRKDYVIQTSWYTDGLNIVIKVSNNGTPITADVDKDLLLEYGYSTALNQRGHGGIGGGEIAQIIRKYGGDVRIISTPEKRFTVTYELKMPLASLY